MSDNNQTQLVDESLAELEVIRSSLNNQNVTDPQAYSQHMRNMEQNLDRLFDSVLDREDLSDVDKEKIFEDIRQEMERIPETIDAMLSQNTDQLSKDAQRNLGLAAPVEGAEKFTVQLGNHRTAAVLLLHSRGELQGDEVIGKIVAEDGVEKPLIVSDLVEAYRDNTLHSSNSNSNGDAWVNYKKVTGITDDFDVTRFFDPSRDGGEGIVLKQVPADTQLPLYSTVVDSNNNTVKFTNFLYEQSYDHLDSADRAFSTQPVFKAIDPIRVNDDVPDFAIANLKVMTSATAASTEIMDTPKPSTLSVRAGDYTQAGMSAYGLVMGTRNFIHSYGEGDTLGMVVSGSDVVISGVDTGFDVAMAAGRTFSTSLASTMAKANIFVTVADVGYQVVKEEGNFIDIDKDGWSVGNKGERLLAGTATAGTAILAAKGMGVALMAAGTTGLAATVLPLTVAMGSTIAVATLTDTIIDIRRIEEAIDQQIDDMTKGGKFMDTNKPSLVAYKQSFNTIRYFDEQMDGKLGQLVNVDDVRDLKDVDFTDPELVAEFEAFIKAEIENQQRIFDETDGFFESRQDKLRNNEAEVNLAMLKSAQEELADFKQELADYNKTQSPSLTEYQRTQSFADVGGFDVQANGPLGGNVSIHGGEQPSLSQDVFNMVNAVDATAVKGSLPEVEMAMAEQKQTATLEAETVERFHYKSDFGMA